MLSCSIASFGAVPAEPLKDEIRQRLEEAARESRQYQSASSPGLEVRFKAIEDSLLALARVVENAFLSLDRPERQGHKG
jgi:hypothetical protein